MRTLLQLYPGDHVALLAAYVLVQMTVVMLLAWRSATTYVLRHGDGPRYAQTLLDLPRKLVSTRTRFAALGLCHPRWRLEDRIGGPLDKRRGTMTRMNVCLRSLTVCVLLTAATVVAGTRIVAAQPKEPPAPNAEETQRDVEFAPAADKKESAEETERPTRQIPRGPGDLPVVDKQPRATNVSVFSGRIDRYVRQFDEQDDKLLRELERLKKEWVKSKERGWKPPWAGYKGVRSRAEYEKMSTADLAKECFSTSLWAREIFVHNKPAYGISRAGGFHDGYSVLYERPDFWDGMVSVYEYLSVRLGKAEEEHERMDILFNLQTLRWAYTYPDFRKTLPGHERDLLRAHVAALKAVLSYTTEAKQRPKGPFWGAQVASGLTGPSLALLKRVDPKAYLRLFEQIQTIEISNTKSSRDQVANYLQLVIPQLEQALTAGDSKTKDTGEDRAEQDASAHMTTDPSRVGTVALRASGISTECS